MSFAVGTSVQSQFDAHLVQMFDSTGRWRSSDGKSCKPLAQVLLLDYNTIRTWYRLYEEDGIEGLTTSATRASLAS